MCKQMFTWQDASLTNHKNRNHVQAIEKWFYFLIIVFGMQFVLLIGHVEGFFFRAFI